jgi:hypothetical protein
MTSSTTTCKQSYSWSQRVRRQMFIIVYASHTLLSFKVKDMMFAAETGASCNGRVIARKGSSSQR